MRTLATASALAIVSLLLPSSGFARTGERSFTPTGLLFSIGQISMARDGGIAEIVYQCRGDASADCLVDLADPAALAQITDAAANIEVAEGEYLNLDISPCPPGVANAKAAIFVKGSVTAGADGGTTYYTSGASLGLLSTTGPAEFTSITSYGECPGTTVWFPKPISVTADGGVTLTLRVDLTDVFMTGPNVSPGAGGCMAPDGGGQGFCLNKIPLFAYLGSSNVTIERYYVAHHISDAGGLTLNEANGIVYLAIDPSNYPLMAFTGPYFSETSPAPNGAAALEATTGPGYGADLYYAEFSVIADGGAVAFQTGISPMAPGPDGGTAPAVGFSNFQRSSHTGQANTYGAPNAWFYRAFKQ